MDLDLKLSRPARSGFGLAVINFDPDQTVKLRQLRQFVLNIHLTAPLIWPNIFYKFIPFFYLPFDDQNFLEGLIRTRNLNTGTVSVYVSYFCPIDVSKNYLLKSVQFRANFILSMWFSWIHVFIYNKYEMNWIFPWFMRFNCAYRYIILLYCIRYIKSNAVPSV